MIQFRVGTLNVVNKGTTAGQKKNLIKFSLCIDDGNNQVSVQNVEVNFTL